MALRTPTIGLILIVVSVGVTLLAIESALRLFPGLAGLEQRVDCPTDGTAYSAIYRAKVSDLDGWRLYVLNAAGHRDTVASGTRRALVLGDSQTFGVNVDQNETFADLLDASLPDTEFVNVAAPGLGTVDEAVQYIDLDDRFAFVVLGLFTGNDLRNNARLPPFNESWRAAAEVRNGRVHYRRGSPQGSSDLLERFHTYRLIDRAWQILAFRAMLNDDLAGRIREAAALTRAVLDDLGARTAADGAPLIVVIIPSRDEAIAGQAAEQRRALLDSLKAPRPEFRIVDLLPVFHATPRPADLYGRGDYHLSAAGHRLAAKTILATLIDQRLTPPAAIGASLPADRRLRRLCLANSG